MGNENNTNPVDGSPVDKTTDEVNNGDDVVKYTSFKKLLDEKKALSSKHSEVLTKLAEYEEKDRALAEQKLLDEKNYSKLLEAKDSELNSLRENLITTKTNEENFRKVYHFLNGLGDAKLESKYFSLIPLESIKLDDSGDIDKDSLVDVISNFKTEHSRLLITNKKPLPESKIGSSSGKGLSLSQWGQLKSSKEMLEKFKDVDLSN